MWPSPDTGTFPHFFKQLEHYTFYGLVATIPKEVPILGAETRVDLSSCHRSHSFPPPEKIN